MKRNTRRQARHAKPTRSAKVIYPADDLGRRARAAMRQWAPTLSKRKRKEIWRLSK